MKLIIHIVTIKFQICTKKDDNVNDIDEYNKLINAFQVMNFDSNNVDNIFQIIASILHLSNIKPENGDVVWDKINIISNLPNKHK